MNGTRRCILTVLLLTAASFAPARAQVYADLTPEVAAELVDLHNRETTSRFV